MGNRNGATFSNLLAKQRNDGARRPQNIAKANHAENGLILRRGKSLENKFRHTFGGAHDVGGAHGLIRRNQYKKGNTRRQCGPSGPYSPKYIIPNTLYGVVFNNRNMLVGCGMIDRINVEGTKDLFKLFLVLYITKYRNNINIL